MIRILRWIALCAAFCAVFTGPASAQQAPPDLFTVAGVRVDQSAANPSVARTQALAQAQRSAFATLVRRLTSPAEQASLALPQPDDPTLDRLVRGVDVEEQPRTSGTRYLGRFAVRFDAAGVRSLLQGAGFSVLESRGAPVLIVPVVAQATALAPGAPVVVDPWRQAWEQGGYAREILPLAVAPSSVTGAAEWATVQDAAAAVGASSGIFAVARVSGNTLVTDLIEVAPGGVRTNRGQVSAAIQGGDVGVPDAFRRLAEAVNAKLQTEFKGRPASAQTERAKMSVSALYSDMAEWSRVKEGLGAAGALISEIRIEAIARDGALVSFMYAGSPTDLQEALRRFGLSLADSPQGPVLRAIPR
jgi:Uncharacterized protein conserved in bacteria (DUF2066)